MARSVTTFLMFEGVAEEALNLYVSLFAGSTVTSLTRYGPGEQGPEGKIKRADVILAQHQLIFFDSPIPHAFTFTPAISFFVECASMEEQEAAYQTLSTGGGVLMPLDNHGFSTRFGWVNDRFGVSWQLNLA